MAQPRLHRTNPHGHTAENCEHDTVLEVLVTMRDDQMSQMLPDGRSYSGAGPHRIHIYSADLPQLERLVESCPQDVVDAKRRHERLCAEWMSKGKGRDGGPRTAAEYPGSVAQVFQDLVRRDMLPVVSYERVRELDTIPMQAKRAEAAAIQEASAGTSSLTEAAVQRMVGEAVSRALAAERERVAASQAKK